MNNDIIDKRRSEIENFLNLAIKNEILAEHIFVFMGISFKANVSLTKNSNTADKVLKFIGKINSTANNKMRLIEKFEFSFFSKRHSLSSEFIYKLLQSLIPLCGDDFIGSKALDVISKLTTSDYYRDFAIASKELCRFAPEYLQTMKLHEYLTKRRFGDSQIQAYTICKMLENSLGIQILFEIVKFI